MKFKSILIAGALTVVLGATGCATNRPVEQVRNTGVTRRITRTTTAPRTQGNVSNMANTNRTTAATGRTAADTPYQNRANGSYKVPSNRATAGNHINRSGQTTLGYNIVNTPAQARGYRATTTPAVNSRHEATTTPANTHRGTPVTRNAHKATTVARNTDNATTAPAARTVRSTPRATTAPAVRSTPGATRGAHNTTATTAPAVRNTPQATTAPAIRGTHNTATAHENRVTRNTAVTETNRDQHVNTGPAHARHNQVAFTTNMQHRTGLGPSTVDMPREARNITRSSTANRATTARRTTNQFAVNRKHGYPLGDGYFSQKTHDGAWVSGVNRNTRRSVRNITRGNRLTHNNSVRNNNNMRSNRVTRNSSVRTGVNTRTGVNRVTNRDNRGRIASRYNYGFRALNSRVNNNNLNRMYRNAGRNHSNFQNGIMPYGNLNNPMPYDQTNRMIAPQPAMYDQMFGNTEAGRPRPLNPSYRTRTRTHREGNIMEGTRNIDRTRGIDRDVTRTHINDNMVNIDKNSLQLNSEISL